MLRDSSDVPFYSVDRVKIDYARRHQPQSQAAGFGDRARASSCARAVLRTPFVLPRPASLQEPLRPNSGTMNERGLHWRSTPSAGWSRDIR